MLEGHVTLHLGQPRLTNRWHSGNQRESFIPAAELRGWWQTRTPVNGKRKTGGIRCPVEGRLEQIPKGDSDVKKSLESSCDILRKRPVKLQQAFWGNLEPVLCRAGRKAGTIAILMTVALFGNTSQALASEVFYDNLIQPGDQYSPAGIGIGHTPAYAPGDGSQTVAATGFASANSFRLISFEMPIEYAAGFSPNGPNQIDIFLANDSAGLPGSTIESWHLTNIPGTAPVPLTTISSILNPVLLSGTPYWIYATGGPDTFNTWLFTNKVSPFATRTISSGVDSGWLLDTVNNVQPGLVVSGDAVPEPASFIPMLIGFLLLLRRVGLQACPRIKP